MNTSPFAQIPIVYLAGGMRSGWQDLVKKRLPGLMYLDPRDHGCNSMYAKKFEKAGGVGTDLVKQRALIERQYEKAYTAWDVQAVQSSHIVFAYLEKDNPGGQGLCVEVGIAKALGRHVIFVEEEGRSDSRYYGMVRAIADSVFTNLHAGLWDLAQKTGFDLCQNFANSPAEMDELIRHGKITDADLSVIEYGLKSELAFPALQV